jgi:hypothetical protein
MRLAQELRETNPCEGTPQVELPTPLRLSKGQQHRGQLPGVLRPVPPARCSLTMSPTQANRTNEQGRGQRLGKRSPAAGIRRAAKS